MFNLTQEESKFEFDFEMASLDMNAGRFIEAETKLSSIGRQIKSSNAYLGIGLCKLSGLLHKETTIEESFYCLAKALTLSDAPESLAVICSDAIITITKQFSEAIIIKSHEQQEAKAKEILSKLILMGSIVTSPLIKKDTTAKWVSTAAGVGAFLNIAVQRNKHVSVTTDRNSLIINMYLLETFTKKLLEEFPVVTDLFTTAFKEISDYTIEHSTTEEQKDKNEQKKHVKELSEIKSSLPSDSPYYTHLENARTYYGQKDFMWALESVREGLAIIPNDDELLQIKDSSIRSIAEKKALPYTITGIVLFAVASFFMMVNYGGSNSRVVKDDDNSFALILFIAFIPLCILYILGRQKAKAVKQSLQ